MIIQSEITKGGMHAIPILSVTEYLDNIEIFDYPVLYVNMRIKYTPVAQIYQLL